jgi:type IV pilus assembly protein PilW
MRPARGITLIEVMVSLLVGSFIALAVVGVVSMAETGKRRTGASADIDQIGGYVQSQLDRLLRSAGSGYGQGASWTFGCRLHAARGGTQILPRTDTLPAPFAALDTGEAGVFRLAPVVIAQGQTTPAVSGQPSDALIVMAGQSGQSEAALNFTADAQTGLLALSSSVGLSANDLILIADRQPTTAGTAPCLVEQVAASFVATGAGSVALSGTYYTDGIDSAVLTGYSTVSTVFGLGNVGAGNPPLFQVIGVGDANTLYGYDLLQTGTTPLQALADGVFELHALYGLDTNGDRRIDRWQAPTGTYAAPRLLDGSTAANARLRTIIAIRVGLVMRTAYPEGGQAAPATLSLFQDLGSDLTFTRTLSSAERRYRYLTLESTIPLRNLLFTP